MRTQLRAVAFLRINRSTQARPENSGTPVPGTGRRRAYALLTTLLMLTAITTTPVMARAGNPNGVCYKFDIAGQTLPQALRNYAQVSGQQIIFTENLLEGAKPVTLQGDYTAEDALNKLLK